LAGTEPEAADFFGSLILPSASPPRGARAHCERIEE